MSAKKKQVRAAFREAVFLRDNHRCVVCGRPAVDPHHVSDRTLMPHGGYVVENGVSLCGPCHELAERYHATGAAHPGYSPDELYERIGSSYEQAFAASERLGRGE
jgi:5-methylcytosine-specific restriction endonuclease McrA